MNIGVLGAGSWAIALSVLLNKKDHSICMWEFNKDDADMLLKNREHTVKLPGVTIPESIKISNDITDPFIAADYILCVVPAQKVRDTMKLIAQTVDPAVIEIEKG